MKPFLFFISICIIASFPIAQEETYEAPIIQETEAEEAQTQEKTPVPTETFPAIAVGPEKPVVTPDWKGSPTPPKVLFKVNDHWTPYLLPEIPEGAEVYKIQSGDTLWNLGQKFLNDPYLWPQLWENNTYITDAHWIYPGDPILLKPITLVTDEAIAKSAEEELPEEIIAKPLLDEPTEIAEEPLPADKRKIFIEIGREGPFPVGTYEDLYCAYYIEPDTRKKYDFKITAYMEPTLVANATYKIVYLNKGFEDGIEPGHEYAVYHIQEKARHPQNNRVLGDAVYAVGEVKILSVEKNTAAAQITYSCRELLRDDFLMPKKEIPNPIHRPRIFEPTAYTPSGKSEGCIVYSKDDVQGLGKGNLVTINLGAEHKISPGDYFTVYNENPSGDRFQRQVIGELVVLFTQDNFSTCKIITSTREIGIGDPIELQ